MKISKVWVGLILASLLINVLFLSYIVANNSNLHSRYPLTAHEYLQTRMDIRMLYYVGIVSKPVFPLGARVYPGIGDSDVLLNISWFAHGDAQNKHVISTKLAEDLETLLKSMHEKGIWGPNPVITCVQYEVVNDEFVEIHRFERRVDTTY